MTRLLITDFDGTLTRRDFYECVLDDYADRLPTGVWQQFESGQLSHFQALHAIFAILPADEVEVMRIARRTQLEPELGDCVRRLEQLGWGVLVVSAGCSWYIERLLREHEVELPVIANPGRLVPGRGLELMAPTDSPYFHAATGIDKAAVVRAALGEYEQVAFAGNGRADLEAARCVEARLRFATGWLAKQLDALGESYHRFSVWSEIAAHLVVPK
jgi:HAD superfamily phosphoserine phosphatase-like hydrolase